MIKIVSRTIRINEKTFEPELELTVKLSLEQIQDQSAIDPKFSENFGKEFLKLLQEQK